MLSHLRHAFRQLIKNPGFSVVAVTILALGIGASTAIFSVVHALLLRPLNYEDARRLVQVQSQHPEQGVSVLAPATFAEIAADKNLFSAIAAQQYNYVNLTKATTPSRLTVVEATDAYFKLFGVAPLIGRTWNADETVMGATPVVVLGEALWRTQFNRQATVIGTQIILDDVAHTVIGVMPASFTDPWGNAQLWRPIPMNGEVIRDHASRYWSGFARLRDDATLEKTQAGLGLIARHLAQAYPAANQDWTLSAVDLQGLVVGNYQSGLYVVLGAVGCVLLITCANIAGLSVVRAIGRRKELALRSALGASRGDLLRQLLGESLLLALLGGGLGVLVANWGLGALLNLVGNSYLPRSGEITINTPVLLVALGISVATGLAFGLAPALSAARTDANDALKEGAGRGSAGRASRQLRSALVVVEIALALVLLVAAGLLGRSFSSILSKRPGIRTQQILALSVSLSAKRYDTVEKRRDFYLRVEEAVAAVPGVSAVGFTQTLPFTWGIPITLLPSGTSQVTEKNVPSAYYDSVGVDFFKATGIPLVAGRTFSTSDDGKAPPVVVISAATARRFFGAENPLGRRLGTLDPKQTTQFEIVGVVGDVLRDGLAASEPPLQIYRPIAQRPPGFASLMIQTPLPPETLAKPVQRAIWSVDPDQAIETVSPVSQLVSQSITQPRLYLTLFGLFAGFALVLAGIGLYGLIAHGVAQRAREFGIRAALGASPREVLTLVLCEGSQLILLGLGIGLAGAFATTRFLGSMVFETSVRDPGVFLLVSAVLALVAAAACYFPARQATRIDPVIALRSE